MSFSSEAGVRPLRSKPDFTEQASDACTSWVYRRFFVGADTITFTLGVASETCAESPRMMFRSASGRQRRVVVTPLYGWNVDALWLTPHFLVFAIMS